MVREVVHGAKLSHRCSDENFALGAFGSIVIVIWRRETTLGAVGELTAYIAECAARQAYGIGLLQVIEETATPPSAATRRALAHMHSSHASHIRRSALVYTKPGFAGAAVRMVMTGVAMLHPPAFEHELFGSLRDAIPWLEENSSDAARFPPGALKAACETLRAAATGGGAHDPAEASDASGASGKMSPRL
jgi:hypothetical protein